MAEHPPLPPGFAAVAAWPPAGWDGAPPALGARVAWPADAAGDAGGPLAPWAQSPGNPLGGYTPDVLADMLLLDSAHAARPTARHRRTVSDSRALGASFDAAAPQERASLDDVFDGAYSPLDDDQVLNMFVDMELLAPQHGGGWPGGAVAPLPAQASAHASAQHRAQAASYDPRAPPPWASSKIAPLPAAAVAPAPRGPAPAADSRPRPVAPAPAAPAAPPLHAAVQLPSGVYHYLGPVLPAHAQAALAAAGSGASVPPVFALSGPPPPGLHQPAQGQLVYVSAPLPLAPAQPADGAEGGACSSGGGTTSVSLSLSLHSAAALAARTSAGGAADAESEEQPDSARAGSAPGGSGEGDTDARRERRILANRRSAARSRLRKMQHTSEMEGRIARLEAACAEAAARCSAARRAAEALVRGNGELRARAMAVAELGRAQGWLAQTQQQPLPTQQPPVATQQQQQQPMQIQQQEQEQEQQEQHVAPLAPLAPPSEAQFAALQQAHAQQAAADVAAVQSAHAPAASGAALLASLQARLVSGGTAAPHEREAVLAALRADPHAPPALLLHPTLQGGPAAPWPGPAA